MSNLPEKVDGGLILRDEDGKPTGILIRKAFFRLCAKTDLNHVGIFVDNAMDLIPIPAWSDQQVAGFYDLTIKQALSYGLTSIHDADTRLEHIDFFKR